MFEECVISLVTVRVSVHVHTTSLWMRGLEAAVAGTVTALKTGRSTGKHIQTMKMHITRVVDIATNMRNTAGRENAEMKL